MKYLCFIFIYGMCLYGQILFHIGDLLPFFWDIKFEEKKNTMENFRD